jgi:hypothetical protein
MSAFPRDHPNLAQVFGLVDLGDGGYALAQIFYCGGSVIELVKPRQGLDYAAVVRYMQQV